MPVEDSESRRFELNIYISLRLVRMRIRIRGSDFGQIAKTKISFAQIETGFLCEIGCGDGARIIGLFARVIQRLGSFPRSIPMRFFFFSIRFGLFSQSWTFCARTATDLAARFSE